MVIFQWNYGPLSSSYPASIDHNIPGYVEVDAANWYRLYLDE